MRTRLAPCVLQAPLLVKLFREVALGIYYLHCFDPPVRRRTPARHNNNAVMLTKQWPRPPSPTLGASHSAPQCPPVPLSGPC